METGAPGTSPVELLNIDGLEYDVATVVEEFDNIVELLTASPVSTADLSHCTRFAGMLWKGRNFPPALKALELARNKYPQCRDLKLMEGEILLDSGDTAKARAVLSELLKEPKPDPAVYGALAEAMSRDGLYGEATKVLTEALEIKTWSPSFLMLQFEMAEKLAWIHYQLKDYVKALEYLEDIIALQPRSTKWSLYIKTLEKLDRVHDAEEARLLYDNVKKARRYENRAGRYEAQEKYEAALRNYQKAMEINPLEPHYYFAMGSCLENLPEDQYEFQLEEATGYYRTAFEMFPNNPFYAISYTGNLANTGKWSEAFETAKTAAEKFPELMLPNLRYLSQILSAEDQYVELLEDLVQKDPDKELSEIRTELAIILKEKNDPRAGQWFEEAARIYQRKIEENPYKWRYHFDLGNCLVEMEDLESARDSLVKALDLHGGFSVDVAEKLSDVLIQLRYYEDARLLLEALVVANPRDFEYMGKMGMCFLAEGDYQKGFEAFNRAVLLNRAYPEYLYGAGVCAARMNRTEDAINIIKDLLEINDEFIDIIEKEEAFSLMEGSSRFAKLIESRKNKRAGKIPAAPSIQLKRITFGPPVKKIQ